jgi:hypothetical protein
MKLNRMVVRMRAGAFDWPLLTSWHASGPQHSPVGFSLQVFRVHFGSRSESRQLTHYGSYALHFLIFVVVAAAKQRARSSQPCHGSLLQRALIVGQARRVAHYMYMFHRWWILQW